jgi:transposase-like protein
MNPPERTAALVAAARRRHDETRRRAVAALRRLDSAGEPVNISTVARAAGVSRAWLYRQADLRNMIDHLRHAKPANGGPSRPSAERATTDSLRQQLDALRARHAELQAENRQLREALARRLRQQRANPSADW